MRLEECTRREGQLGFEDREQCVHDFKGLANERDDFFLHSGCDGGRVGTVDDVWVGEGVVFGDVDEFDGVGAAMLIRCVCSGGFVAVPAMGWN